jgi:DNA-binding MarR family transcriptional regulator
MKTLIEIQREAEKHLGVYTLSTDYEIIYVLMDLSDISPDALYRRTRLSSTAFYNKLKDLERAGAVLSKVNPDDRRSRLYGLSVDMRILIMNQHKGDMDLLHRHAATDDRQRQSLNIYQAYIHKGKIVNHLTAEFQILLYLYLKPRISNLNISSVIDVSITKFNTSLTRLASMGLVKCDKNPADGRSKLYYLPDQTQGVLDDLHRRIFRWLEARS